MQTTLNKIKQHNPCTEGWAKLLSYLNKTEADDEPLELTTILESNGIEDALWALRAVISGKNKKEVEANAKLIAAAPELLEALQEYVNNEERGIRYANRYGIPHQVSSKYRLAKAAIKKATE